MTIIPRTAVLAVGIMALGATRWEKKDLDQELLPIAFLESSYGLNINHRPHSRGDFYSSYGALGLKPSTAYDEYVRSPSLRSKWPGLNDPVAFTTSFKAEPELYRDACNTHWHRMRSKTTSLARAVFSWRWGYTAAIQAKEEQIAQDQYVVSYLRIHNEQANFSLR